MTNSRHFIAVIIVCTLALAGCKHHKKSAEAPVQLPVAMVEVKDVPVVMEFTGEIDGYVSVAIDARASGYLRQRLFREGSFVKRGELLYIVEPAPYTAQTARSMAAVKSAEASLKQAQQNYDRVKPLSEFNAASRSDLDTAIAQLAEAKAQLASSRAALTTSQIDQSYTRLTSPIDGIIGKTQADVGAFVGAGSSIMTLNTVSLIDSVVVDFYIPEALYTQMMATQGGINMYNITLTLSTGEVYPHLGRFNFVGREVQSQTGAMGVEVVFSNPDKLLRPGAFALISVVTDTLKNACLIPQQAVNQIQGNDFVYLLDSGGNVKQQGVTSGRNVGNMRVIAQGLKSGETVITEGFHKLHPGVKVEPQAATKEEPKTTKK